MAPSMAFAHGDGKRTRMTLAPGSFLTHAGLASVSQSEMNSA
jgi:hypothetical protein